MSLVRLPDQPAMISLENKKVTFYIHFIEGESLLLGEICIENFKETFESPLGYWSVEDYQLQWSHALDLIVGVGKKSCLVTSFHDPKKSNFFMWWLLYRRDEQVIFQNQVFFLNRNRKDFNEKKIYDFIPEYRNINPKGQKISEWTISTREIQEFLAHS